MGDELGKPSAGWYRNVAGQKQWWDGETWGPIAPEPYGPGPALGSAGAGNAMASAPALNLVPKQLKSTGVAYILFLLFAGFGAHRFYLNAPGIAVLFIITWAITTSNLMFSDQPGPFLYIAGSIYILLCLIDLFTLPMQVQVRNEELVSGRDGFTK